MFNRSPLCISKISECILKLSEVGNIGIQLPGVGQVLVHIIEVSQDDISPEDEIVQGLGIPVQLPIALIEFQKQGHPPGRLRPADLEEELVHCQHLRGNHRNRRRVFPDRIGEVFPEEDHRSPVRENEAFP